MRFALSLGNDDGLSAGATAFEYDDHGRTTKVALRNGAYSTYQYDRGSRLTRLVNYHSPWFSRGMSGSECHRSLRSTADAGVTRYVAASNDYEYDANSNILAIEQDFNGVPLRTEYEYDPLNRLTKETTCEYMNKYYYSAAGDRVGMNQYFGYSYEDGGTKFYVNADVSTRYVSSAYTYNAAHELTQMASLAWDGGRVTRTYNYDQAGRLTRQAKVEKGASSAPTNDILFTGKDYDPDLELYYFNARWYDPETGRFVSRSDEVVALESAYLLCENNPLNQVDPDGHNTLVIGGEVGGAIGNVPGAIIGAVIGTGIGIAIWILGKDRTKAKAKKKRKPCPQKGCKPCIPPVGSEASRLDFVPPSRPHPPFTGTHMHIYEMHQSPRPVCKCFWHEIDVVDFPFPPLPDMPDAGGGGPL